MEGIELYIFCFIGIVIHFVTKFIEYRQKKMKIDKVMELLSGILSVLIGGVIIYGRAQLEGIYPITLFTALGAGYSSQSVLRFVIKSVMPKNSDLV